MGMAAIGLTIASTVLSVAGSVQQAKATKAQTKFQQGVARNNQIIANQKADDARRRGQEEEQRREQLTRSEIGANRARAAARGVVVDEGSNLAISEDIARAGKQDALTIRNNAEREALGFEAQAVEFQSEASLRGLEAEDARRSALFGAGSSLLTGATSVASKWHAFKRS